MDSKDFVTYETAKRFKECGFNELCNAFYWTCDGEFKDTKNRCHTNSESCDAMVTAPTLWQAQKWLREKKHLSVEPYANIAVAWNYEVADLDSFAKSKAGGVSFPSYEQALQEGIKAALELIKSENASQSAERMESN